MKLQYLAAGFVGALTGGLATVMAWHLTLGLGEANQIDKSILPLMFSVLLFGMMGLQIVRMEHDDWGNTVHIIVSGWLFGATWGSCSRVLQMSRAGPLTDSSAYLWRIWTILMVVVMIVVFIGYFRRWNKPGIRRKEAHFGGTPSSMLMYACLAGHVLFVSAYQAGQITLRLERTIISEVPRIDAHYTRTGWLSLMPMRTANQIGYKGYKILGGTGLILIGPKGSADELVVEGDLQKFLVVPGDPGLSGSIPEQFPRAMQRFLGEKKGPAIQLHAAVGPAWWQVTLLMMSLLGLATALDPLTAGKYKLRMGRYTELG